MRFDITFTASCFNVLLCLDISDRWRKAPTEHEPHYLLADMSDMWYEIRLSLKVSCSILNGLTNRYLQTQGVGSKFKMGVQFSNI